jgi:hypothetical protein
MTRLGRWIHNRSLNNAVNLKSHVDYQNVKFEYGKDIVVYIIPYLTDNYGYIVYSKK